MKLGNFLFFSFFFWVGLISMIIGGRMKEKGFNVGRVWKLWLWMVGGPCMTFPISFVNQ